MKRIAYYEMVEVFERVLLLHGCNENIARKSAMNFADNSRDGVYSHGVYRFLGVVDYIKKGYIRVDAEPEVELEMGCFQRWNGNLAMGNTNAQSAMAEAIRLAEDNVVGVVALRNTNHWMRGGAFGWQAADAGMIGMCWTNTMPNMPAWGTKECNIGNNPVVLAVPGSNGRHVVVDCAMSQYSYGKIGQYNREGRKLPYPGGFDSKGSLTDDPAEIEMTGRILPAGLWKGAGLSIAFDLIAAVLAGGDTVTEVGKKCDNKSEYGVSQLFMAINPDRINEGGFSDNLIDGVIESIKTSAMSEDVSEVMYPGERVLRTRKDNLDNGIPVERDVWEEIYRISSGK